MTKPPPPPLQGIMFTLEGASPAQFEALLADLKADAAFARPLQIQVRAPQGAAAGQLTIAFAPAGRDRAVSAMQRLKTLMLRHGLQVDDVRLPQPE